MNPAIDISALPGPAQKILDPNGPPPLRAMAAKGVVPGLKPGDIVTVVVREAAPHHLVADTPILTHRRTRAGDRFEQGRTPKTPPIGVGLGLPQIGAPEPLPARTGCGA